MPIPKRPRAETILKADVRLSDVRGQKQGTLDPSRSELRVSGDPGTFGHFGPWGFWGLMGEGN